MVLLVKKHLQYDHHLVLPGHIYMVSLTVSSYNREVGESEVAMWKRTKITFGYFRF